MFSCVVSLCLCASVAKNKKSRAKQRGTSLLLKFSGLVLSGLPELFSGFFYVAASRLNSPRFPLCLYAPANKTVKRDAGAVRVLGQFGMSKFERLQNRAR
jgi:hypothetical protein